MKEKRPSQILFISAGTITILGAFARIFNISFAPYVFSIGAAVIIYLQGKIAYESNTGDKRKQRLARLGFLTSLMLGVAAYFMFTGPNSGAWVVMVLMYALSSFYQSFRGN
jgi:hypothetical protein